MRLTKKLLILMVAFMAFACDKPEPEKPEKPKSIVIIYENDVHCAIEGYPKLAAYRDAIAASDTAYVLTVSCGDFAQGGIAGVLSRGEYPVDIMNSVGYDAVTVGNHEFDYKLTRFYELMSMLKAPVVNVNISDPQGHRIFDPYVIKECGDKKVAFVGGLTPSAEQSEFYAFFDEGGERLLSLNADTFYTDVQRAVDDARKQGADYVVFLSHVGDDPLPVNSIDLMARTSGIDVLLDGHTHGAYEQHAVKNVKGDKVICSQTGTAMKYVGKLVITPEGKFYTKLISMEEYLQKSDKVQATVDSVTVLYNEIASRKAGICEETLSINDVTGKRIVRSQECALGSFVAEAYRAVTGAQIGLVNGGGVRTDLKKGDVTYQNLIDVNPFGNSLSLAKVSGGGIVGLLTRCSQLHPGENGSFAQVAGLRFTIDKIHGNQVVDVQVQDEQTGQFKPIDVNGTYTVGITDYFLEDNKDVIGNYELVAGGLMLDYEALIKFVSEHLGGVISADYARIDGRIKVK